MVVDGSKNQNANLAHIGIHSGVEHWNLSSEQLVQQTLDLKQGVLNDAGALCVSTGKFTGRSPKDKFTVKDSITEHTVDWGEINIPFSPEAFDKLYDKMLAYLEGKEIWVRDAYAGADPTYRLDLRVINENPWSNLFCHNLFLRPTEDEIKTFTPEWLIVQVPSFLADPAVDGTRQGNFTIVNFTRKTVLIGGSAYTGEMKKGIFGVLNFILPAQKNVLSMHCSANEGKDGDVSLFFGLSGTGKTTLSADPNRPLIGDDEHGWADGSVFNFEGGCYAKVIDLSHEKEPQIFDAIRPGTILENITFIDGTNQVNYKDGSITENTRAAYPIYHIDNAKEPSFGGDPKNIFFLTCDAFGVLPPISKLTKSQAMYHFVSGYTAKVAGTEVGITEPKTTFSACFGKVFLPLHPIKYAELLGKKLEQHEDVNVWLINTGWSGGAYGTGKRMNLKYTRAMITAAMNGSLNNIAYNQHNIFGVLIPEAVPEVPTEILNPQNTWENKEEYITTALKLAKMFVDNFEQYASEASEETLAAAPITSVSAE
ncbi:MAG TPA: phosphoenolpyruvate carboxykinase (ATP) [Edaphocola sp.]|nr:phosphoenolpyruvate carboxykinase (ATP) [Edaphocola sp.]